MGAGDGRGAMRAATVRVPAPACRPRAKWHAASAPCAICPDAAPPRIRGIHRAGGVTAHSTSRIAPRERQVEISHALPTTSAKNRCSSQPADRVPYESLCLLPRSSARGSRTPRSVRSPRRVCRYWSCARHRQSSAGRGSPWRTSVCCSRAPNPRHPSRRR